MSYADKRVSLSVTCNGLTSPAASAPLASFIVPADKRIDIFNFRAFVSKANTAATLVRLTDSAGTALASLPLSAVAEGSVQEATECASGPVGFTSAEGCNGDSTVIHIVPSAQLVQFRGTIQADFSYPGSK